MTKQDLHGPQVAGSFVDERDLGPAQAVGAAGRPAEPDRLDPFADKAGILAGAEVPACPYPAREDVVIGRAASVDEPGEPAVAGLLRQLELDRLLSFLLDDACAVTSGGVHDHLADLQPDQIVAAELAVDGQVEHR